MRNFAWGAVFAAALMYTFGYRVALVKDTPQTTNHTEHCIECHAREGVIK